MSLLMMGVVTTLLHRCGWSYSQLFGTLRPRTETSRRRFERVWLCSYRAKFPSVAGLIEEHPPKRQQQAAAAKAPEITPFTS